MHLRNFFLVACLGVLLSLCCPTSKAEAILASVKSTGMAATAIAYPLDTLCGAYNPAGEVLVGDRLDLEGYWLHDKGHSRVFSSPVPGVNGSFNGMSRENFYLGDAGINKVFCCECFNWSIGLIGYGRDFQKTRYKVPLPLFGVTKPGLEYVHVTIAPILAIQLWECAAFGISVDWHIQRLKVNGLENFAIPVFSLHPRHVTNKGYDYSHGVGVTIGSRYQICDCLGVGFTYRPKTHMEKFHKYDGFLVNGRIDIPEKVGAGIEFCPFPCLVLCFDWEWLNWKKVRALHNELLHDGILFLLGSKNGPGFGFVNQNFYRVGVEWTMNECWILRAGFRHARSPFKSSQTAVNTLTLDCVENFVTVGATYNWDCWNEISVMFAYGFEKKVKGGPNSIPAVPFGGGGVNLTERKYALGLAWGWHF